MRKWAMIECAAAALLCAPAWAHEAQAPPTASPPAIAAPAPPVAKKFLDEARGLCIDGSPEPALVVSRADEQGWMPMPKALMSTMPLPEYVTMSTVDMRLKSNTETLMFLVVGDGSMALGGDTVAVRMCAMARMPMDNTTRRQVDEWLTFAPIMSQRDMTMYAYKFDRNGAKVPASERDARQGRGLYMMGVGETDGETPASMLMHIAIQPRNSAALSTPGGGR